VTDDRHDDEPEPLGPEFARAVTDAMRRARARFDEQERLDAQRELAAAQRELADTMRDISALPTAERPAKAERGGKRLYPSHQLPRDKVEHLDELLDERREAGNPHRGPLTLEQIGNRVGLEPHRVTQGRDLKHKLGWDLLKSDPDFPPDPGYIRWPTVEKLKRQRA
jgi:hypothetical protein